MQRPCKERLRIEVANVTYSICLEEDMWLDCIAEDVQRSIIVNKPNKNYNQVPSLSSMFSKSSKASAAVEEP